MKKVYDRLFNSNTHETSSLSSIFQEYMEAYPKERYSVEFFVSDSFYRIQVWRIK